MRRILAWLNGEPSRFEAGAILLVTFAVMAFLIVVLSNR